MKIGQFDLKRKHTSAETNLIRSSKEARKCPGNAAASSSTRDVWVGDKNCEALTIVIVRQATKRAERARGSSAEEIYLSTLPRKPWRHARKLIRMPSKQFVTGNIS